MPRQFFVFLLISLMFDLISPRASFGQPNFMQSNNGQPGRKYPIEVGLRLEQGSLFLEQGNLLKARNEFEAALQAYPECPEAYNNLGLTFYRQGDLANAANAYEKAIEIDPLFSASISNLAVVRYQEKRLKEAAQLFNLALGIVRGKDAQLQYNLANVLRDSKQYDAASEHYLEAIKLKPEFHAAYNGLGATYYCTGDYERAEKEVRKAISLKGDYALGYYHLGLILAARNHLDEASQAYAKSLKFEKNNAYKQDTQGKIKELEKLIVRHESPGAGGNSAFPLGNYHSVDAVRRDAITALIASGQYAKAESQLKPLVSDEFRRDPSAWNNYGFALMKQHQEGKDQESLVALNKAIELSSGNLIEAHYNLAQILRRRGDFYGAERACVKAMGLAAKQEKLCPLVHNLYGILLKRSGRLEEADRAYSLAIAQSMDKLPVAHYNRAIVLEKRNKTREAVVEYQNYLKKSPSGANAERARRRLKRLGK